MLPVILVLLLGVAASGTWAYVRWCRDASGPRREVRFRIPSGATGAGVIASLKRTGVVRCEAVTRFIAEMRGLGDSFEAGDYRLQTNMTVDETLEALGAGPLVRTVSITIPEGMTAEDIAAEASQRLGLSESAVRRLSGPEAPSLPPYLPPGKPSAEGFLFPKTYTFDRDGVTPEAFVRRLLDQFALEAEKLPWGRAKGLGVSPYEVVTIASMVEREARLAAERPRIAAVIYNRLRMGEPLGIDATLQYVDPNPKDGLTQQDLEIDSPYNTRRYRGLPPTPIANPGLASLRAALRPLKTDDWLYVLCGPNGRHAFTSSYSEFLVLKERCLG